MSGRKGEYMTPLKDDHSDAGSKKSSSKKKSRRVSGKNSQRDEEEKVEVINTGTVVTFRDSAVKDLKAHLEKNLDSLPLKCTEINIEKNQISNIDFIDSYRIPKQQENYFKDVRRLFASSNMISRVNLELKLLEYLDLSENYIEEVPLLMGMPKLRRIRLANNKISVVTGKEFTICKHMEVIDISYNKIDKNPNKYIPKFAENLDKCKNLVRVYVTGNPVFNSTKALNDLKLKTNSRIEINPREKFEAELKFHGTSFESNMDTKMYSISRM